MCNARAGDPADKPSNPPKMRKNQFYFSKSTSEKQGRPVLYVDNVNQMQRPRPVTHGNALPEDSEKSEDVAKNCTIRREETSGRKEFWKARIAVCPVPDAVSFPSHPIYRSIA
jgi:hypothetical protein